MFHVSAAQYDALAMDFRLRYHREILGIVKEKMPFVAHEKSDDELLARIEAAHVRAESRGIIGRADIAKFAVLDLSLGPEFDKEPRIDAYLQRRDLDPTTKMDSLTEKLVERLSQ